MRATAGRECRKGQVPEFVARTAGGAAQPQKRTALERATDLFETLWKAAAHAEEDEPDAVEDDDIDNDPQDGHKPEGKPSPRRRGRQPLGRHLKRERIVHDLADAEKHCACCGRDLRLIAEETSERYEYIPASLRVIQDVCLKYACDCTVKTAGKPPQPIEKSTAGASLLAQVIVSKFADHQPLHRQEQMFQRHGVEISRKTMGAGWRNARACWRLSIRWQKRSCFGPR